MVKTISILLTYCHVKNQPNRLQLRNGCIVRFVMGFSSPEALRFHVGGVYRGVRSDER